MSFGWSVGDILTVVSLGRQMITALSSTKGAIADYRSLLRTVTLLVDALRSCYHSVSTLTFEGEALDADLQNGLKHHLDCCTGLINEFLASWDRYSSSFLPAARRRGSGEWFVASWRKISWNLGKREDVLRFERRLADHITAFQVYADGLCCRVLASVQRSTLESGMAWERIERRVEDVLELAQRIHEETSATSVAEIRQATHIIPSISREQPVKEFDQAIAFVNKVKKHFREEPEVYKAFLEILRVYQRDGLSILEVYRQVEQLLVSAPDLLDEFHQFLPTAAAVERGRATEMDAATRAGAVLWKYGVCAIR